MSTTAYRFPDISRKISPKTRLMLAVLAGGRCEFAGCNDFVFEHHLTRQLGVFGQNAHIVAFGKAGPRASAKPISRKVHDISNLMLLCPKCHKQIDDEPERFPVEVLARYKLAHETRIRLVTGLGPDMRTEIVQLKATVGGQPVGIPAPHVYEAVAPRYPADTQGCVIDLTALQCEDASFYASAEKVIKQKVDQMFTPGVETRGPRHLSVFALAPIPLLVVFGSLLGNKVAADVYQRHRDTEAWCWKTDGEPVEYAITKVKDGARGGGVALVLSLSGKVPLEKVEVRAGASATIYEIGLKRQNPTPSFLRLREDLARFASAYREALALIRTAHPAIAELGVFPAVPAPVAVVIGRELLPKVDPVLLVHDFDKVNGFQQRAKVNAYDPE